MARKIKIPNEDLKRFARHEARRKQDVRAKRIYYLIVCEGEATEPNYFEGLKKDLPQGVLMALRIDIEGTGRNTQSLVDEALRLKQKYEREQSRPVDRLWVVFDRDSFSPEDFNSAVMRCSHTEPAVGCAWSNEAFELWYLLHFHFFQNGMSRKQYQDLIEQNLRTYLGPDFRYRKNSKEMYAHLKAYGSQENAIRHGKALSASYEQRQDFAYHNPCTMVWKLVEELMELITESKNVE